ncbi:MAG: hypothetical protein ACU0CO_03355, partial [Shimia sp.]
MPFLRVLVAAALYAVITVPSAQARTAGALCGDFNRLFKAQKLSESTYNVLRILRGAQKSEGLPGLPSL